VAGLPSLLQENTCLLGDLGCHWFNRQPGDDPVTFSLVILAEAEGFEPPDGLPSPAFKFYASLFIKIRRRTSAQVERV
jgi:hypothetical protein